MEQETELNIELKDTQWPYTYTDHDRLITRAVCFDDDGFLYFNRAVRADVFGEATIIETAGGGAEAGEDLDDAVRRELKEELGVQVEIIAKIGTVSDYYNLIHRHNINHYYLCRIVSFGEKNLTRDEIDTYHLSTLKVTYEEAAAEYGRCRATRLGELIGARELPVLERAGEILRERGLRFR